MADQEKLQLLIDRTEISEVVHRYATGIDSRDWKLFRSIFTDEIELCLTTTALASKTRPRMVKADKFADGSNGIISHFSVTQHFLSEYHIEVSGNEAVCVCYMQARHFPPAEKSAQPVWDIGGYYTYHLVRTAEGWKIPKYTLRVTWEENRPPDLKV